MWAKSRLRSALIVDISPETKSTPFLFVADQLSHYFTLAAFLPCERVFEETENVADCILAWPTRSQNMIFFEQRESHYGFIESPRNWLGETFTDAHGYHSSESVLKMLENADSAGAPEWHDFLYIRKPGEKTWARRFCVIRNSGLYTTKKNKRAYTPTGLIRLLVFDEHIHIYTTTGGWSRMHAPTPHGFALKVNYPVFGIFLG
ncbi:unnamed protein product [Schistocephalus solidus]|uniref:PH domain-containing protein n=1 Tax=Schistocephalus solidus TaxID=70667 RepID=A0A183TK22_SCHSO|nr:unnamed protein product [Schistocephalus solidus]